MKTELDFMFSFAALITAIHSIALVIIIGDSYLLISALNFINQILLILTYLWLKKHEKRKNY